MPNKLLLICFKNPFEKHSFLFCKAGENIFISRDISILKDYEEIISYGFEEIVDELRLKKQIINQTIFDIITAVKLITGKPKSAFKIGSEPWALRNIIGKGLEPSVMQWLNKLLQLKEIDPTKQTNFDDLLIKVMNAFENVCKEIFEKLKTINEHERYFQLEVPLYNIFIKVQLDGISVSQSKLENKLLELKKNYYSSLKTLELNYNLLSYDIHGKLTLDTVKKHYLDFDYPNELNFDFWEYAKLVAKLDDPFFINLVNSRNSKNDYEALLKYNFDKYKKIYPQFDIMGTVTGRILITKPGIQYLKKSSRSFFEPCEDSDFLYADFDRFEPGIIAQLSEDIKLRKIYNSGDIYLSLSNVLFKTPEKRKLAKTLFLAFTYGMSEENLEKLVYSISKQENTVLEARKFFNEFSELIKWKKNICDEARINGFSSSVFGGKRYIDNINYLSYDEQRWIPNQKIQGTAAVIFKKSLLELNKKYPGIKLLIPMHDAILVEVKKEFVEEAKKQIITVFNSNFKEICPDIRTSASLEKFSD